MIAVLLYGLAVIWTIGCAVGCVGLIRFCWKFADGAADLTFGLLAIPLTVVGALLPWAIYADAQSPDLATLKKGDWVCTETRVVNSVMPISTGKTTTIVPTTRSECITYARVR